MLQCVAVRCIMLQCIATNFRTVLHSGQCLQHMRCILVDMGWLRLVGFLKSVVSFAKEPYKRDDILQTRKSSYSLIPSFSLPNQPIFRFLFLSLSLPPSLFHTHTHTLFTSLFRSRARLRTLSLSLLLSLIPHLSL